MLPYVFIKPSVFCMRTVILISWHTHTHAFSRHHRHKLTWSPPPSSSHPRALSLRVKMHSCLFAAQVATRHQATVTSFALHSHRAAREQVSPLKAERKKTRECLSQELRDHLNVGVYTPLVTRTEKCQINRCVIVTNLTSDLITNAKTTCVFQWPLSVSITSWQPPYPIN